MAFTNFETREIHCKVLFLGPRGSGKTANLHSLFQATSGEVKSGLFAFDPIAHPAWFDFLPVSVGEIADFHVKLHLFTLPNLRALTTVPSVITRGVDGFVFVADSRMERMIDNIECWQSSMARLSGEGANLATLPRVIQYNKRDLSGILPVDILRAEFNPSGAPEIEAVATKAVGTMETLTAIAEQLVGQLTP